jgi:hypothetical protein
MASTRLGPLQQPGQVGGGQGPQGGKHRPHPGAQPLLLAILPVQLPAQQVQPLHQSAFQGRNEERELPLRQRLGALRPLQKELQSLGAGVRPRPPDKGPGQLQHQRPAHSIPHDIPQPPGLSEGCRSVPALPLRQIPVVQQPLRRPALLRPPNPVPHRGNPLEALRVSRQTGRPPIQPPAGRRGRYSLQTAPNAYRPWEEMWCGPWGLPFPCCAHFLPSFSQSAPTYSSRPATGEILRLSGISS